MKLSDLTAGIEPTKLLYLADSYQRSCEARVLRAVQEKKRRIYLVLDQTIFHPKGGGQPTDRGLLHSSTFTVDIRKAMYVKGVVAHFGKILQGTINDSPIVGEIDWARRYQFMKRHTAGHLLDHCLTRVTDNPVETTDSWLGEPCYVGYRGLAPPSALLDEAVKMANAWIREGRPVTIETVSAQELVRRAPHAPNIYRLPDLGAYRIVTIQDCLPIPCAGTHLRNIHEVEHVAVSKIEQRDTNFRVYYESS